MGDLVILGKLKTTAPLHVGTGKGGEVTDSPARRNAAGGLVIPGRALGGSLRATATRLAPRLGCRPCLALFPKEVVEKTRQQRGNICGCPICQLFGELYPNEQDEAETGGRASRLSVYDALAAPSLSTAVRDGVGLDRVSGTAAGAVKFDLETIPPGTIFDLRLRLELKDLDAAARAELQALLAAALAEWQSGRGHLGGNSARGLNAFRLETVRGVDMDLRSSDGLMCYLRNDHPWEKFDSLPDWLGEQLREARKQVSPRPADIPAVAGTFVRLEFTLEAEGPFLSYDEQSAAVSGFDLAPLRDPLTGIPVLAGASLRGALRARAERIARTLAMNKVDSAAAFLARCPACHPHASESDKPLASCDALLSRVIHEEDEVEEDDLCLACRLFGSARRGSRLIVEDAPLVGAADYKPMDFLAIDRFTGGGLEGAKFDAAPLRGVKFQVRLWLENPATWEIGWLALVLRDFANADEGWMTLGMGAAKGLGRVKASDFKAHIGFVQETDLPVATNWLTNVQSEGIFSVVQVTANDARVADWIRLLADWTGEFVRKVDGFQRGGPPRLPIPERDVFFGLPVQSLYVERREPR